GARLPAAGEAEVEAASDLLLIKLAHPDKRSVLRVQRWSGEPPEPDIDHRNLGTFQVTVGGERGGREMRLFQLPLEVADREKTCGAMLPLPLDLPPGDYKVRLTAWDSSGGHVADQGHYRYLAQFWDA
ncbi:hypothetical protein ACFQ07_09400, partial [Actinomadura adrarensis]